MEIHEGSFVLSVIWEIPKAVFLNLRHLANADVIAEVKRKITVSRQHFVADVIFSASPKVHNYQNKTG